jgi:beta-galactosidase
MREGTRKSSWSQVLPTVFRVNNGQLFTNRSSRFSKNAGSCRKLRKQSRLAKMSDCQILKSIKNLKSAGAGITMQQSIYRPDAMRGVRWTWAAGLTLIALSLLVNTTETGAASPRERSSFNADWRFTREDPADTGTKLSYTNISAWVKSIGAEFSTSTNAVTRPEGNVGSDIAYTQAGFDDRSWRQLNLPHDFGIEGPFKQEYPGETGKLPWWGVVWYRKHFSLPDADQGRRIYLEVDGAMAYANVWLNGQYVGGWPYGYASWRVDLTPYVKTGGENVIAIRLDNPPDSSRWYPGGGIYRNVWLVKTSPIHVAQWGTYVTTPEVSSAAATVNIEVKVANTSEAEATVRVKNEIFALDSRDTKGKSIASLATDGVTVGAKMTEASTSKISLKNPRLWSIENPHRYAVVTTVEQNGKVVDTYETPFGIRTFKFTADNGFILNGKRVALQGVCNHHDLGALGAALNVRALERQLEILREMGCNAIRTSHNPPAPELLDLTDRMGFVVMDEAFDCWKRGKKRNDYHLLFDDWHEKDWRAQLRRDRNHPSIVLCRALEHRQ